jgi:hypothetical protein
MTSSTDIEITCRCGKVHGTIRDVAPARTNRVVCHCDDCQAYAHYLEREDLLDAHGGTDVVQIGPANLSFDRGVENIAAIRLSPKGAFRWTATCCNTPLGNTAKPSIPFVGIPAGVLDEESRARFGEPIGRIMGKFAVGEPPPGSTGFPAKVIARSLRRVLGWKLGGKSWPHPYFERSGALRYPERVISKDERKRLRALCGPKPA